MSKRRRLFVAAVAAQLLLLLTLVGVNQYTLATGTEVFLRTVPVDPRSLFQGDYVDLRYEISTLSTRQLAPGVESFRRGERVWVRLAPGADGYWQATELARQKPPPKPGTVLIRGRTDWSWQEETHVRYGIEAFFVPEGEGRALEQPEIRLDVTARVDRFGRAALYKVFVDGQEVRWR